MRKIITYILTFIIITGFIGGGYLIYRHYKKPVIPPAEAIPASAVLFLEFGNLTQAWNNFSNQNEIFSELLNIEIFRDFASGMKKFDSLAAVYPIIYHALIDQNQYISIHPDTAGSFSALLLAGLNKDMGAADIVNFMYSLTGKQNAAIHDWNGHKINVTGINKPFYYSIYRGVFTGSHDEALVKESLHKMEEDASTKSPEFLAVQKTAGKKVDANIYLNQSRIGGLMELVANPTYKEKLDFLKDFASWTELDLIMKKDEILLNGYTSLTDSLDQYLSIFREESPQKVSVTRILPYNTNLLVHFGFENFSRIHEKYLEFLKKTGNYDAYKSRLSALNNATSRDILKYFTPWIGKEIALVMTRTGPGQAEESIYTVIHAGDPEKAGKNLQIIYNRNFILNYKGYEIHKLYAPNLMPALFGGLFEGYDDQYFTNIENYFIFANSYGAIENYINSFESGKSLKNNINYKKFADNISDHSNILFYLNLRNTSDLHKKYLSEKTGGFFRMHSSVIPNFEGISLQFSSINNMFYTNLYVKYNPSYVQEDYALWKVELDDEIRGQPYFVEDHRTNTLKIIVFDDTDQMYLIDHNGKILWKRMIGEPVIGDVYLIDYYRNGKIQYLFNTAGHIHLIDLTGRNVENYPIRLPGKATNGIAVFDYDNNRDYRLIVAMEDNRIYNFDKKGIPVNGWKKPLARNAVVVPVQHIRAFGKDYIVITDSEGNIRICNRRGEDRILLHEPMVNAANSKFYENNTNSRKGVMLTTDEHGKLTYIKTDGSVTRTDFGNYSPDHYFLYEDFDRNGHKDFIFLDKNQLNVFDRFKNPIMSFEFKNEIASSPVIIPLSKTESIIGIVSGASRKIYLFDKDGNLLSTPDMVGKTQILVGSLLNDGQLNIITGSGNTLYNYYFQ